MEQDNNFTMPLVEAMETQRAIRRLKPDPVEDALVLRLIELALNAPTGSNAQNWEFIVVKDASIKKVLVERNRQAWRVYGGLGRRLGRIDARMLRIVEAVQWQADHFEQIPVVIVACLRGLHLPLWHLLSTSYFGSIYPAIQNLLLAARSVNLGATLITLPLWNVVSIRRTLKLPWYVTPCAVIPLCWPLGRYGPTRRKPVREVVSFDVYGNRPDAAA